MNEAISRSAAAPWSLPRGRAVDGKRVYASSTKRTPPDALSMTRLVFAMVRVIDLQKNLHGNHLHAWVVRVNRSNQLDIP